MYLLAFSNFIRSRSVLIAITLFLVTGVISLYIGSRFLQKQQAAVEAVAQLQQAQIERNVKNVPDQFGLLMYYLRFAYINKPDPLAALAIGQQDINNSIQYLTVRGLEGQRYDTGLFNPYNQLTGNLDLSFVILFLFPLLIIAFNFNVLSQEAEEGTWPLVRIQAGSAMRFIVQKLSIRLIVVLGLLLTLLGLAVVIVPVPLNSKLLMFSVTSVLYIVFWFAVSFLIMALRYSSAISALLLLSCWVLLCLLGPAMVNSYLTARYPVQEAYSTFLKQRDGYHTKWDADKDKTMEPFFKHYPQFSRYVWNNPKFNYMWYYAMQQAGDDEAAGDSKAMQNKLRQRRQLAEKFACWIVPMQAQLALTDIAGTGLQQQQQFLDSTAAFHESTKLHFYPRIFTDGAVSAENWAQHVPRYFKATAAMVPLFAMMPLLVFTLILGATGVVIFRRKGAAYTFQG